MQHSWAESPAGEDVAWTQTQWHKPLFLFGKIKYQNESNERIRTIMVCECDDLSSNIGDNKPSST